MPFELLKKLMLLGLLAAALLLAGCARQRTGGLPGPEPAQGYADLEEKWGIRPESVRYSAAGRILDFRYRVTDPEKAKPILSDRKLEPFLIDQASGTRLPVPNPPKVGPLRQTTQEPEADRVYFSLFSNPGVVEPGDKVTVVIGDFRAENLIVK